MAFSYFISCRFKLIFCICVTFLSLFIQQDGSGEAPDTYEVSLLVNVCIQLADTTNFVTNDCGGELVLCIYVEFVIGDPCTFIMIS